MSYESSKDYALHRILLSRHIIYEIFTSVSETHEKESELCKTVKMSTASNHAKSLTNSTRFNTHRLLIFIDFCYYSWRWNDDMFWYFNWPIVSKCSICIFLLIYFASCLWRLFGIFGSKKEGWALKNTVYHKS